MKKGALARRVSKCSHSHQTHTLCMNVSRHSMHAAAVRDLGLACRMARRAAMAEIRCCRLQNNYLMMCCWARSRTY